MATNDGGLARGSQAERDVHLLNVRAVFEDFAFKNPMRPDTGKELADSLIWFGDSVVVLQVKSRATQGDDCARAEHWLKKNAAKAIRQANGTLRALRDGRVAELTNERRGILRFDRSRISTWHSVVILDHPAIPIITQQDLGGTGLPADAPVHVVSLVDWDMITSEHDTTADLLRWLDQRASVLPRISFYLNRERDALAVGLVKGAAIEPSDFPDSVVPRGYAEKFAVQYQRALERRAEADELSKLVDEVIDAAHTGSSDLFPTPDWISEAKLAQGSWTYADIAAGLAATQRLERRLLGEWMFEKATLAGEDGREHYFAAPLPSGTWFIFVASPQPRKERALRATLIAYGLKQQQKATRILGIATEPAQSPSRTYDMWLLDVPYAPDVHFEQQFGRRFKDSLASTTYEFPAP